MKNLYLNFCKLATLVLMIGLSVKFLAVKAQSFPVSAVEVCPGDNYPGVDANGWTKIEPLSGLTYTFTGTIPPGFEITQNCMKVGNHDPLYGVGATVTNSTLLNGPGNALQDISHASFRFETSTVEECDEDQYETDSGCVDKLPVCNDDSYDNYGGADGVFNSSTEVANNELCDNEVVDQCDNLPGIQATIPSGYERGEGEFECVRITCQETVLCPDACRTQSVVLTGICGEVPCEANAETCSDPTPTPTPTPTPSPEVPGYNCPVAQSCSNACGQPARDIPNGSCGYIHCDPTPACGETPVGGVVLGTTTAKPAGQVLGATTEYAATGVAEDFAFSLIGFAGTGLSGLGILMKRHAKASN